MKIQILQDRIDENSFRVQPSQDDSTIYSSSFSDSLSVIGNQIQLSETSEESNVRVDDFKSYSISFSEEELKE